MGFRVFKFILPSDVDLATMPIEEILGSLKIRGAAERQDEEDMKMGGGNGVFGSSLIVFEAELIFFSDCGMELLVEGTELESEKFESEFVSMVLISSSEAKSPSE